MSKPQTVHLVTLGLVVAGVLAGSPTFAKCRIDGCPGDTQITADVKVLFDKHPELGSAIDVQTRDHVVYLHGLVDTPLESEIAKEVALEAPGVARVENSVTSQN
jgi:osmotically-inducible protein OsmY